MFYPACEGNIYATGGPGLIQECITLGGCDVGCTKITDAYNLPCRKVFHTVGPIYNGLDCSEKLIACYQSCLELALEHNIRSLCFSCISTGKYGYPNLEAADIAVTTLRNWYVSLFFAGKCRGYKNIRSISCIVLANCESSLPIKIILT